MTRHPEHFDRGSNGQPYDPNEPLLVRWADVLAARNAVQALLVVMKDEEVESNDQNLWMALGRVT